MLKPIRAIATKVETDEEYTYIELQDEGMVALILPLLKKADSRLVNVEQKRARLEDFFKGTVTSRGDSWVGLLPGREPVKGDPPEGDQG